MGRGMNGSNQPKAKDPQRGSVSITYSNYKVNKGLPDSIFAEKKKK
jgi:outer membrane lipoprotein-sorting protein